MNGIAVPRERESISPLAAIARQPRQIRLIKIPDKNTRPIPTHHTVHTPPQRTRRRPTANPPLHLIPLPIHNPSNNGREI